MRKFWIPGILAVVIAATVSGQAILEYGAAAAGGSAAGVAGKKVSDSLDKVMTKVSDMTKSTATEEKKPRKMAPAVPPVPEVRLKDIELVQESSTKPRPSPVSPPARRQANLRPVPPAPSTPAAPVAEPVAAPAPVVPPAPVATVEDLKSLDGATREDVLSKMGKPASRITISDERGLVETYSFKNSNGYLGSVRIINGKVTEVRPVQ